jgi:hypothetical protein
MSSGISFEFFIILETPWMPCMLIFDFMLNVWISSEEELLDESKLVNESEESYSGLEQQFSKYPTVI